jgi:hypothetical protein
VHAAAAKFGSYGNVILTCKNSGLTPATHFAVNATAKVVAQGKVSSSISFVNNGFKIWSSLGAGEELTVSILEGDVAIHRFKNQDSAERLLISGQIIYTTIFNHDHMTQFAFYVEQSTMGRFRRPTANLTTFWRIPKSGAKAPKPPVPVLLDENDA